VTQIFQNGQPSHGGGRKIFEVMTSTLPKGTLGSVASVLAAINTKGVTSGAGTANPSGAPEFPLGF
jgi:hypothetical protein